MKTATGKNLLLKSKGILFTGAAKGKRTSASGKKRTSSSFGLVLTRKLSPPIQEVTTSHITHPRKEEKGRTLPLPGHPAGAPDKRPEPDSPVVFTGAKEPVCSAGTEPVIVTPSPKAGGDSAPQGVPSPFGSTETMTRNPTPRPLGSSTTVPVGDQFPGTQTVKGGSPVVGIIRTEGPSPVAEVSPGFLDPTRRNVIPTGKMDRRPEIRASKETASVSSSRENEPSLQQIKPESRPASGKRASAERGVSPPHFSLAGVKVPKKTAVNGVVAELKKGNPVPPAKPGVIPAVTPPKGADSPAPIAEPVPVGKADDFTRNDLPRIIQLKSPILVLHAPQSAPHRLYDAGMHESFLRLRVVDPASGAASPDAPDAIPPETVLEPSSGWVGEDEGEDAGKPTPGGNRVKDYPGHRTSAAEAQTVASSSFRRAFTSKPRVNPPDPRKEKCTAAPPASPDKTGDAPPSAGKKRPQNEEHAAAASQKVLDSLRQGISLAHRVQGKTGASHLPDQHPIANLRELVDKIRARAELLKSAQKTVLEMRLNPPKLGTVFVQVELSGEQMRLSFSAEHPEAASALQQARGELTSLISQHGYTLVSCDVENHGAQNRWAERSLPASPERRGSFGKEKDEAENDAEFYRPTERRMVDYGYNTMELVA